MKIRNFCALIATLGPLGYLPAPGTWGSLVGLCFAWVYVGALWYPLFVAVAALCSWIVINCALSTFTHKDPSAIILDEVVGMLMVFCALPFSLSVAVSGFLLFRFFDISKCCGVKWFEKFPRASGILLDDCFAALISHLVLRFFFYVNIL